jgi:myo-inositol-1(or 4)-monophosphatase
MTALEARLESAVALAIEAGKMAMRLRPPPGAAVATLKGVQDWLTEADGAVEKFLSGQLEKLFPADGFQGEETGNTRAGVLRWVVDPIDGTSNYARGSTRFCVSVGLLEGDVPVIGVIVAPALGEIFAARRGGGATLNGAPIRVAETTAIDRAIVEIGWSRRRPTADFHALCARVTATGAALRKGGSGALGLADVAAGRTDAYAELHINLWDVAAGMAILHEASAFISPFMQSGGGTEGAAILAATPGLAPALRAATEI